MTFPSMFRQEFSSNQHTCCIFVKEREGFKIICDLFWCSYEADNIQTACEAIQESADHVRRMDDAS